MSLTRQQKSAFLKTLWGYYAEHARVGLPWRMQEPNGDFDPYKILVSEIMLQQTQVGRVIPKYTAFIALFPSVTTLAEATLAEVLRAWQGLGYNRRAKYLWLAAQSIASHGWPEDLTNLPGVGVNTKGAIQAYAFNQPAVFIETNIRTVYMYHFTRDAINVSDSFIRDFLEQTLDTQNPREFYWAVMDYGAYLKTHIQNLAQGKHYKKQTQFNGSKRQIRGRVVRVLGERSCSTEELRRVIDDDRLGVVLQDLQSEGIISKTGEVFHLG